MTDSDTASQHRVCEEPDCSTVLSRYNTRRWCSVHDRGRWRPRDPRSQARRSA